jgi:Cu+-exporting ATPase
MALEPDLSNLAPTRVEYTCPMHPEIVRDAPGSCPICGMALEPRTVTLEDQPNPELVDMTRRFWIAAALGLPVFLLTMGDMVLGMGLGGRIDMDVTNWIGLVFATPVVLWAGWPFFERAWASIVNRSPNMFTLIGMGVGAAYLFSAAGTIAPGLFPEGFRVHGRSWCSSARCWSCARAAGRRRRSSSSSDWRRRPRACCATAVKKTSRCSTSWSATRSACVPARKCRSTAS